MSNVIEITKDFPPTRERTLLEELLRVVRNLHDAEINAVIRGVAHREPAVHQTSVPE